MPALSYRLLYPTTPGDAPRGGAAGGGGERPAGARRGEPPRVPGGREAQPYASRARCQHVACRQHVAAQPLLHTRANRPGPKIGHGLSVRSLALARAYSLPLLIGESGSGPAHTQAIALLESECVSRYSGRCVQLVVFECFGLGCVAVVRVQCFPFTGIGPEAESKCISPPVPRGCMCDQFTL